MSSPRDNPIDELDLHDLAIFMSKADDWAIFRRFRYLNMKNILCLQRRLARIEKGEIEADGDRLEETLHRYSKEQNTQTFLFLFEAYRAVDRSLVNLNRVYAMSDPKDKHLRALCQSAEARCRSPNSWNFLPQPKDAPRIEKLKKVDLVAVCAESESSVVHNVVNSFVAMFADVETEDDGGEISTWSGDLVAQVTRTITTGISALLLVTPIVILYFVKDGFLPLVVTVVWTVAFSVLMSIVTQAKNSEIMVASATYAAVMVVFIGT
ncbi:hypothetical protein B0T21DRAFT_416404 [Apiosordaria backusii]|uniref:DUF6594 domain-containing protein n=1 Tax=Apiosordaria backusii TaxID=314023 RepID=A0AA40A0V5_9PEZI|nr:hypothetical protein B0T21DRAFT_416404 [Apiosordaria backusii]